MQKQEGGDDMMGVYAGTIQDVLSDAENAIKSRGYRVKKDRCPQSLRAAAVLWGENVVIDKDLAALHADVATRAVQLILWKISTGEKPVVTVEEAENPTEEHWTICAAMSIVTPIPERYRHLKEIKSSYREATADGAPLPDQPETPAETDAPPKKKAGGRRGRPPKNAAKTPETAPESTGGA